MTAETKVTADAADATTGTRHTADTTLTVAEITKIQNRCSGHYNEHNSYSGQNRCSGDNGHCGDKVTADTTLETTDAADTVVTLLI